MKTNLKPIKRGIVGYVENKNYLIKEALCLYQSIKQLNCSDIDLILFGTPDALRRLPDDIIKVESKPYSQIARIKNYKYINSIGFFKDDKSKFLENYDYLLRTDLDTFILPKFKTFLPKLYTVGRGGYCNDDNTKNMLKKIADENNLNYRDEHNLGSTNYGNGKVICEVGRLATDLNVYILNNYFKNFEGNWPGFYRGVTSMYANELAVNHLVNTYQKNTQLFDFDSSSDQDINDYMHIHCWHSDKLFSKFKFNEGKYNNLSTNGLDLTKINNYCLDVALKSRKYYK